MFPNQAGLKPVGTQRDNSNSCGAYALRSALASFDENGPIKLQFINPYGGWTDSGTEPEELYIASGVLTLDIETGRASYDYNGQGKHALLNPPSTLFCLAQNAGATPKINIYKSTAAEYAKLKMDPPYGNLLTSETKLIENKGGKVSLLEDGGYKKPQSTSEIHLVLVRGGEHWVTVNPTELYDPGTGKVYKYEYRKEPEADRPNGTFYDLDDKKRKYGFHGLWIALKKPETLLSGKKG